VATGGPAGAWYRGYSSTVVGEYNAVLFEGGLDPPVGLAAHFELLSWRVCTLQRNTLTPGS
jgi:hypothetical protein